MGGVQRLGRVAACIILLGVALPRAAAFARLAVGSGMGTGVPPSCLGLRDLLVTGHVSIDSGSHTYQHVCIEHGGSLAVGGDLTLRAGDLYVGPGSSIAANGTPRYIDCHNEDNDQDPQDAHALTIVAREATILGAIIANGAAGIAGKDNTCDSSTPGPGDDGTAGGRITIEAASLTLAGAVTADGGAGGAAGAPHNADAGPGNGGHGGSITILSARPQPAAWSRLLSVRGGADASGHGAGASGTIAVATLTATQRAQIPPPAVPAIVALGTPPTAAPLLPAAQFGRGMACGAGDLIVAGRMALSGTHYYPHICVDGTLRVPSGLTLVAQTIHIGPRGVVSADAAVPAPPDGSGDGQYLSAGDPADRRAPHAGVPGNAVNGPFESHPGAAAGGTIALVARRILIEGTLSANGGAGAPGIDGGYSGPDYYPPEDGGAGGSGGGILVVAHDLQVNGAIATRGGAGGAGGSGSNSPVMNAYDGDRGSSGCVKLFADTLRVAVRAPVAGAAVLSRMAPPDPVPPDPTAHGYYAIATEHTLSGAFLAYWRRYGGLPIFGYPLSEPFRDRGRIAQYTERFLLEQSGAGISVAPLGRLLTAGRSYPTVAPFPTTSQRMYFPATGHSLSGRFLAFWRAHAGRLLLGAPISEPVMETNGDGTGRRYLVQWFEDGRLEYHPEQKDPRYQVEIGLLGKQALERRGWP